MVDFISDQLLRTGYVLWGALETLLLPALFFAALALIVKRREAFTAAAAAMRETRLNLSIYFLDALFVVPLVVLWIRAIKQAVDFYGLDMIGWDYWNHANRYFTMLMVVFFGDFIGYWRHRFEHSNFLWPTHAVHHSDTKMTWFALFRFHPINRFTTAGLDTAFLALLGFPEWALVVNNLVRHYYGFFIHSDVPWNYGPLRYVFITPVMHRWHHSCTAKGTGSNFATVFCVFDRCFGTFYAPGVCNVPLGVSEDMGKGLIGQLTYPFKVWYRSLRAHPRHSTSTNNTARTRAGTTAT